MASDSQGTFGPKPPSRFIEVRKRYSGLATAVLPIAGLLIGLLFDEAVLGALCGAGVSLLLTRQEIMDQMRSINEASKIFDQVRECAVSTSSVVRILEGVSEFQRGTIAPLPNEFVDRQVEDLGQSLKHYASGEMSYYGERWDWFEHLADACSESIDAVSTPQADLGLWGDNPELEIAYLNSQRRLVERQKSVRRIFVLPKADRAALKTMEEAMDKQYHMGIDVRFLLPSSANDAILDQVVFDSQIVLTTTFSAGGAVANTLVSWRPADLQEARQSFTDLWKVAESREPKGW